MRTPASIQLAIHGIRIMFQAAQAAARQLQLLLDKFISRLAPTLVDRFVNPQPIAVL